MIEEDNNLEMLLVGLFPQNKIKVDTEIHSKFGMCIDVNVDDKKIKFKIPEIDPIERMMFSVEDWAMEYSHLIVQEIRNQLNQNKEDEC